MIDALTISKPPMNLRPKIRWWLPGRFIEPKEICREITVLAEAGYGGAEVLYFFPVPPEGATREDIDRAGFGGPSWNAGIKAALETALSLDFCLDFTIGPAWPIATPSISAAEDNRASNGLHIAWVSTRSESGFSGKLPLPSALDMSRPYELLAVTMSRKESDGDDNRTAYAVDSAVNLWSKLNKGLHVLHWPCRYISYCSSGPWPSLSVPDYIPR